MLLGTSVYDVCNRVDFILVYIILFLSINIHNIIQTVINQITINILKSTIYS